MDEQRNYDKISGWLWLPAIALLIQPLGFFTGSILPFLKSHGPNFRLVVNIPILIGDLFLLSMVAIVAWFYFHRKRIAPALYILQIIIMALMWEVMDGLIEHQNDPPFFGMIFHVLVIIPFLTLSNRVKETFVEELDSRNKLENIFVRFSHNLAGLYLRLRKKRYIIFVFAILFLFFSVILNCAIRSLRINGDLLHTFDYLI
jgi:diacylglycerol kinase